MAKNLVIVESPAKARTINKYLGADFEVLACYGHVRDLVPKEGAVDPDHDFAMKYATIERNAKRVDAIAKAISKLDAIYLATDPDREGEAISWHLSELLRERGVLDDKPIRRVVFYEVTQRAIQAAFTQPRGLSTDLINAQQARRALDYLVGFKLSPLLWKKITSGLSAGRVQSPALRLIVEREQEIERFTAREYWTIEADLEKSTQTFVARLFTLDAEKIEQFSINTGTQANAVTHRLAQAADGRLQVAKVERKQRRRNPAAPFITSTLQQEASRKLRFSAQKTMRVAQQLYEGIDTGSGATGLITYIRTDSVSMAQEAVANIQEVIAKRYGRDNLPAQPHHYRTRAKNAQEAHEAIRPTDAWLIPDELKAFLTPDQYRLYELIWQRAVACQMIHATINTVAVDLACGGVGVFRATGSTIANPGFMAVYLEGTDDAANPEDSERTLPSLEVGDEIKLQAIRPEQHFTEAPPRYSEASLVRALEEWGIGRPSTYASILSTLQQRNYVLLENRRFWPTDTGRVVIKFLKEHFDRYVDYDFTARMEDDLDAISRGEQDWIPVLRAFWEPFKERIEDKNKVSRGEVMQARELGVDPASGRPVTARLGRYGPYAQIGSVNDEAKPSFAGLIQGQSIDTITLEAALALFKLPRELGETPQGEKLIVGIGRYGPYVRYANKFVSLKREDDPYTITRERALERVAEKKEAEANRLIRRFDDSNIEILRGRFGPYITDGKKNARIPKDREPGELDLEECRQLLSKLPERKSGRRGGGQRRKSG
ncbi:MAG: DNA topoisomerase I [Nitrococcus sp.]|nr:DNA topoisomerase I [Nitrococcus sp.]